MLNAHRLKSMERSQPRGDFPFKNIYECVSFSAVKHHRLRGSEVKSLCMGPFDGRVR